VDAPAFGSLLALKTDIFKVSSIPQRIEVSLQSGSIIYVAWPGEDPSPNSLCWNTTLPMNLDVDDDILLALTSRAKP